MPIMVILLDLVLGGFDLPGELYAGFELVEHAQLDVNLLDLILL